MLPIVRTTAITLIFMLALPSPVHAQAQITIQLGISDAVEGCRDGRRVRVRINRLGEPVERQQLGQC